MKTIFHSVRWRLQLWHALILLVTIALLCLLAYKLTFDERHAVIDREFETFERAFITHLFEREPDEEDDEAPPSMEEIRERFSTIQQTQEMPLELRGLFDQEATDSVYLAYWDPSGNALFISENAPSSLTIPELTDPETGELTRMRDSYREIVRGNPRSFRSVVGRDISDDLAALDRLAWEITFGGAALWLVGLVGGWWLAGRAIKPIDTISQTATRIAGGEVSERIDIADTDNELGQLSRVLNDTFDRLASAIERQREFTADASHELRTPLTVILSETSRGLKRDRTPEEHREILSNCSMAAQRMRGLVESLLLLARQDMGSSQVDPQDLNLAEIADEAIELLLPLADEKSIQIKRDLHETPIRGDSQALGILCQNLISNAIHHQSPNGEITVRTRIGGATAILEVADQGPGIAPEHLARIFDRFYRIDTARVSRNSHSGLGLAICQAIADNHQARIEVQSELGKGSLFRITFPRL